MRVENNLVEASRPKKSNKMKEGCSTKTQSTNIQRERRCGNKKMKSFRRRLVTVWKMNCPEVGLTRDIWMGSEGTAYGKLPFHKTHLLHSDCQSLGWGI